MASGWGSISLKNGIHSLAIFVTEKSYRYQVTLKDVPIFEVELYAAMRHQETTNTTYPIADDANDFIGDIINQLQSDASTAFPVTDKELGYAELFNVQAATPFCDISTNSRSKSVFGQNKTRFHHFWTLMLCDYYVMIVGGYR